MSLDTRRDSGSDVEAARTTKAAPPHDATFHVRNYDVHASHTVEVTAFADPETVAFSERYHLGPGQSVSERDVLSDGTYAVEIRCDRAQRDRAQCDVGDRPDRTALVEIGNGAVSITQGGY